jgi:hypothetical protein
MIICLVALLALTAGGAVLPNPQAAPAAPPDPRQGEERTSFQSGGHWDPGVQIGADVAMAYGIDPSIGERIGRWRDRGYIPHVMTGVAWGQYQDYLYGRFDGINHVDEAQTDRNGNVISHGGDVYYMSPGENYGKFLCVGVKRAIDAGAQAIHLEEPEFWVRGGYSKGFQREWRAYYHEDWIPPHTSPDAQYRASLLKYYLYRRALKQVFDFVRDYNRQTGKQVRCYVATHTLINYSNWGIVSPESSLIDVGADGFIAQTWTGTARTPNFYDGKLKERTFETAFLEYGSMMSLVRASGKRVWFLNDPVEDDPNHTWTDYRQNWESTLTASLLWPTVWRYEVMPWPERVFHGQYPNGDTHARVVSKSVPRIPIPPAYGTELQTVIGALNDMRQPQTSWRSGTRGLGIVVSDSMMFQRGEPHSSDQFFGSFYGLSMPLVKRGMPLEPVQLENAARAYAARKSGRRAGSDPLKPYRVLLLTYEGMKPLTPEANLALADWVKSGGVMIYVGDDRDPYNHVRAWWNSAPYAFKSPREQLFQALGLPAGVEAGVHASGAGSLIWSTESPAALSRRADGGAVVAGLMRKGCELAKISYRESNGMVLRRGPYVVAAGLDESVAGDPIELRGRFLDLFDGGIGLVDRVTLTPGARRLLLDVDRVKTESPTVLAAACKVTGARHTESGGFEFFARGPEGVDGTICLACPKEPKEVSVGNAILPAGDVTWNASARLLWIRFPNSATGVWVNVL